MRGRSQGDPGVDGGTLTPRVGYQLRDWFFGGITTFETPVSPRMSLSSLPATVATQLASLEGTPLLFSGQFLQYAVVFFVIAIVAAVLGARGIAGVTMEIAKWLVIIFLVLAVVSIVL